MIQAAEAAIDAGVTMVFAVGNDGPDTGTIISPAMSPKVIGVGASTKPRSIASGFVDVTAPAPVPENLTGRPYGSAQFGPEITSLTGPELYVPVEKVDTSGSSLACGDPSTTLPAGSLTGKIALISRGVCQFSLKVWNAQNAGAIAAIVYNSAAGGEGLINMAPGAHASEVTIPSAFVARSMGLGMTSFYDAHPGAAMVQIDPSGREVAETPDQIIGFSSRGPTNDQYLKPDVVAPGVNVLSAGYGSGPNPFVGFGQVSGTSMATPHVAGAAALLKQLHPDWQPWQIKSALMSTAKVDGLTNVDGSPAMVLDRGAGRIDLTKAGDPGLTFDWPGVGFGTVHPGASAMVTINAKSVIGINAVYDVNIEGPASGVTFAVNVRSISLTAGGMASFQVSMTAAADAAPGDYEGMVMLHHGPHDAHIPLWVRVLPARSGAEVLLVDDDASSVDASFPNYSEYYTRTLEVLGVGYTYLDIGAEAFPPLDELSHYRTVLWFTGDNDSFNTSGFFTADLDRLAEWLDTGGRLLATGQNFADVSDDNTSYSSPTLGRSRIYHGYLGATWATGSVFSGAPPRPSAMGDAPVLGEMRIDLSPGGDGAGNQTSVEAAIPMTDTDTYAATRTVMPLVHPMGGTLPAGAHIGLGRSSEPSLAEERLEFLYRSVYLGFGLEGVNDDTGFTTREQLAGKLLDWLKDEVSVNLDGPYTSDAARLVTLHATATSSKGTIAEYRWDFGDGSPVATGTANTVTHVYPSSGRFTAKVMAVDSLGHSAVDSASISAAAVAEIPASASGYVDSLNRLGAYFGSGYLWTGQDTRPKTPRWLHGVVQFDLTSHIPAGATIVAAQVELTGRDVTYVSGQPFEVSLKLLDPNVDPGFAYLGYYQIHNASAVASAPMEAGSFGVGVANRFMFNSSAALAAFQSRLEGSGKASFRADGVLLAPYGRDIVGWDGRASAAPVLRIVYITE
jgi:subtilisin family serine protease